MVLAGLVALTGLVTGLAMVSVEAYPDTYRRTDTGYTAVSVAQGAALFQQHCTRCHGEGGRGDGPAATGLPRKAANLTEPHTALHTAGDIFWWLSHGRPEGGMPGFSEVLSVEQRWDLVNFLRAFSAGHQARILTAAVAPGQPWLGPPDFDYDTTAGQPGSLSGQRGQGSVLLVFYAPQGSAARLQQLAQSYPQLRERHAEVLAVPWPQALGADSGLAMVARVPGRQPAASAEPPEFSALQPSTSTSTSTSTSPPGPLPFPVVTDGSLEAATAYRLFRRTLADAGRTVLDAPPPHMEFLIDRFGYLRARWLPQAGESGGTGGGWGEMAALLRQIELLEREPPIRPPPDDHVH
jgi:putative copper resistance protein D